MWREKTKPKRRQQRYSLLLASPTAVTLQTINILEIFRKFTVFLVSVCVTVNKEH